MPFAPAMPFNCFLGTGLPHLAVQVVPTVPDLSVPALKRAADEIKQDLAVRAAGTLHVLNVRAANVPCATIASHNRQPYSRAH